MKRKKTAYFIHDYIAPGIHPENGPIRFICIKCEINEIKEFTMPRICDDCLCSDEAYQLLIDMNKAKRSKQC